MGGKHMDSGDRATVENMLRAGHSQSEIARAIGVHKSTISREIRRGLYSHTLSDLTEEMRYSADLGQKVYDENGTAKGPALKIGNDHELANYIKDMILNKRWSPDTIIGRIKQQGLRFLTSLCTKTVYNYIDNGVFLNVTRKSLWMQGKRKRKYDKIQHKKHPKGRSIETRPQEILERKELGHWEMDTVIGQAKGQNECLLVLTERAGRNEIIMKIAGKNQVSVINALDSLEFQYGARFSSIFRSITIDNGCEFLNQAGIEASILFGDNRTTAYYCHPYTSAERGSNENHNRFIRRFIPKGENINNYTHAQVQQVQDFMNNYPRKILGYRTLAEVFADFLQSLEPSRAAA